jgi:hypothetical protein
LVGLPGGRGLCGALFGAGCCRTDHWLDQGLWCLGYPYGIAGKGLGHCLEDDGHHCLDLFALSLSLLPLLLFITAALSRHQMVHSAVVVLHVHSSGLAHRWKPICETNASVE